MAHDRVKEAFEKLQTVSERARVAELRSNFSFPTRTHVYTPSTCHHNADLCRLCRANPAHCRRNSAWHPSMTQPKGLIPPVQLFLHVRVTALVP